MAAAKDCHELTSHYAKQYKEKYGVAPTPENANRVTARWNFDSVLQSMSKPAVKELIDYYFTTSVKGHPLDWFFYNYGKLFAAMEDSKRDKAHRAKLMEESKIRAERWRQSGRQGIADAERSSKE